MDVSIDSSLLFFSGDLEEDCRSRSTRDGDTDDAVVVSLILLSRSISSRSAEVVDEESVVFSPSNLTFVLRFLNLFDFPFIF